MDTKTFDEWSTLGYRIHKGSKASGFKGNLPLFTEDQVYIPQSFHHEECDFDGTPYSNYTARDWEGVAQRSPGLYMDLHSYHKDIPHDDNNAYTKVYNYENCGGNSIY